jgi:ParB family transcriptional regulator, chromosome partitioning protein
VSEPRRGLGRGLSALLGEERAAPQGPSRSVPIERLHPGKFQPRRRFDEAALEALAQSIASQGVVQPILVRRHPGMPDHFEILAGERRWRAAQQARLHDVPILIRDVSDRDALELALVENLQREDLSALDEAQGYQRLLAEFTYTQEQLAQRIGKSRSHVANTIRLLALPDAVKTLLDKGELSAGHARALLGAKDAAIRSETKEGADRPATESRDDPNVKALERDLSQALGLKVAVRAMSDEAGEVAIRYRSLEQLDGLIARLKGPH